MQQPMVPMQSSKISVPHKRTSPATVELDAVGGERLPVRCAMRRTSERRNGFLSLSPVEAALLNKQWAYLLFGLV